MDTNLKNSFPIITNRYAGKWLVGMLLSVSWFLSLQGCSHAIHLVEPALVNVDSGWAANSVNAVVFRKNALFSFRDTQFISYYNQDGAVVLGKRQSNARQWELKQAPFHGNMRDAHNSISMIVDGDGYLHLAWDQHNNALNYSRSKQPLSLEMDDKVSMTGATENSVSYPEFYRLAKGDLLFLYRDGGSGRGNLVVNKYTIANKQWLRLNSNLIDGEGKRNAYWQAYVDHKGIIHLSWVWRESPDVASNHDMCYARSTDGGITWERSSGEKYKLPVTAASAEYICRIPQGTDLINQTSICTDGFGNPVIASYWKDAGSAIPQYHIIYRDNNEWKQQSLDFRKTPFSLSGGGTKQIPIARPQVIAWNNRNRATVAMIFRDEERGSKVSVAVNDDLYGKNQWKITDLTGVSVGSWEPSYDTELWRRKQVVNLFIQYVQQADAEGISGLRPQMIQVLAWKP